MKDLRKGTEGLVSEIRKSNIGKMLISLQIDV